LLKYRENLTVGYTQTPPEYWNLSEDCVSSSLCQWSSKSELRRKFEQRKWLPNERFAIYFEDKMMLANPINLDTEELLEQIIEGVPSKTLRDQARKHRPGADAASLRQYLPPEAV